MRTQRLFVVAYGFAHLGKSLFWHASELLFAYFLTEACGLAPRLMAAVLAGSLLLNAVSDIMVGRALTSRVQDCAAAGRAQLIGAVFASATFVAFGLAGLCPASFRLPYAAAAIILFRLSYSFYDIPQNAILGLSTHTDGARARLSAYRFVFGGCANLAISTLFVPLIWGPQVSGVWAGRFALLSATLGAVALGSAAALHLLLRRYPGPLEGVSSPGRDANRRQSPVGDRQVWLLVLMLAAVAAGSSAFGKLEPYLAAYGLSRAATAAAVLTCVALGNLVSQPVWAWAAERFSLTAALRASAFTLAAAALLFPVLVQQGAAAAGFVAALYGAAIGGLSMTLWAFAAAGSQEAGRLGGAANTFGLMTGAAKVGSAAAVLGVGEMLADNAYRDPSAWAHQLLLIMTVIPVATALVCAAGSFQPRRRSPPEGVHVAGQPIP